MIVDEFGNPLVQVDPKALITGSKIFVASQPTPTQDTTNLADSILNNILYGKGGWFILAYKLIYNIIYLEYIKHN